MFISISDIFDTISEHLHAVVPLRGCLLVQGDGTAFLAADHGAFARGERIRLVDDGVLGEWLLQILPPFGGGDVIYKETAFLSGTLTSKQGMYELERITYCRVIRDDWDIVAPLGVR